MMTASATINGTAYSGANQVQVLAGGTATAPTTTSNANIVLSPTSSQGSIAGTVKDNTGAPILNARVVAAAPSASGNYFTAPSSFLRITDSSGSYTMTSLPPLGGTTQYTVTASAPGHVNQTQQVTVSTGQIASANFRLAVSTTDDTSSLTDVSISGQTLTVPLTISKGVSATKAQRAINAIRNFIMQKRGLLDHVPTDPSRVFRRSFATRGLNGSSYIESDLFWNYGALPQLLGYEILRSDSNDNNFQSIAVLRDPLATAYTDADTSLTAGGQYYYAAVMLDTVGYTNSGEEGPVSTSDVLFLVPLGPLSLSAPANNVTLTATPKFAWSAVSTVKLYQVLVYSQFPDYQSDTSGAGVRPIWPADMSNPGASLVSTGATSQTYQGPALTSGHTYYWTVLAEDSNGAAFSTGPIWAFTAP
jgi:hypothetical protein